MDRFQLFRELIDQGVHRKLEQLNKQNKLKEVGEKMIEAAVEE